MFFDGWQGIFRVVAVGVPAYAALVFLLRISGKRTLSKMNAFDLVITVAFGSTLATILLSTDVALAEGVAALALLIALQFIVAWSASRWAFVDHIVKAEPVMVYHRGRFLTSTMRRERVTKSEILAAIRGENNASTTDVESVVLETTGDFSVIRNDAHASEDDALDGVRCPSSCSTTQVSAEPSADQPCTLNRPKVTERD